jgi:hypothetical protein
MTEKILTRLLFDRNPRLTLFADKIAVREYVSARVGVHYLTRLYGVIDQPSRIRDLDLPPQFVMKPSHLTGAIKIVSNAETADRRELEALAKSWLARNHGVDAGEWAYRNVRPRVMFEELLDVGGYPPPDYKIHCFDGAIGWISVFDGRFRKLTCALYDAEFRQLPVRLSDYPQPRDIPAEPPANFVEMVDIARKLSTGVDYVRVDLYSVGERVVFGELTNYPGAGLLMLDPRSWDLTFGQHWLLADYRDLRRPAARATT